MCFEEHGFRQFTHNLIVHHTRVALCEVGKYLAEQKWKGVPHSLSPPPDFAQCQSRRKSHNLFREVPSVSPPEYHAVKFLSNFFSKT